MPRFIIYAPAFTHRSSGVRALYRLCHHLNVVGCSASVFVPCEFVMGVPTASSLARSATLASPDSNGSDLIDASWKCRIHEGLIEKSDIVVYPEVVHGNPLAARKVVRWLLHEPGRLGGSRVYPDDELIFVYDRAKISSAAKSTTQYLGESRILWVGLIDPKHIYPSGACNRVLKLRFIHKGHALAARYPLELSDGLYSLESLTPSYAELGNILRASKVLYSFDHYSNLLREAVICGCDVKVIDANGHWHDPRVCSCVENIDWGRGRMEAYAREFEDSSYVQGFVKYLSSYGYM